VAARRVILWDNLCANDYNIYRAYMGCYQGRNLELCSRIAGIMINPNCTLNINMPMRSVCRFVECGVQQLAYSVAECHSLCASEWAPLVDGPMTPDNVFLTSFIYNKIWAIVLPNTCFRFCFLRYLATLRNFASPPETRDALTLVSISRTFDNWLFIHSIDSFNVAIETSYLLFWTDFGGLKRKLCCT